MRPRRYPVFARARAQKLAASWNEQYRVGLDVLVTDIDGTERLTVTTAEARVPDYTNEPVVECRGRAEPYPLRLVRCLSDTTRPEVIR